MKHTFSIRILALFIAECFLTTTLLTDLSWAQASSDQNVRKEVGEAKPLSPHRSQTIFAPDSVSWQSQTKFFLIPPKKKAQRQTSTLPAGHLRPSSVRDGGDRLTRLQAELDETPPEKILNSPVSRRRVLEVLTVSVLAALLPVPTASPFTSSVNQLLAQETAKLLEIELSALVDSFFHANSLEWIASQKISRREMQGFDFSGSYQSYQNTDHPYSRYIVQYGRVWTYDVALGIYSDLKNGKIASARGAVNALVGIAKTEEEKGFKGLWHFSYNTVGDNFIDPRGPLGANLWAVNAIYSYILQTGDTTHLAWLNEKVQTFIFGQQVMDPKAPRYGLFRAGLYNAEDLAKGNAMGYDVYEGDSNVQNENVFIEHNADAAGTLRLAYHAAKRFGGDEVFKKSLIQRHELLMRGLQKFWMGDHFVTGMNADGTLNQSVAVDNESWVGAVILPYDEEKAWQAIQYLKSHFVTTITEIEFLSGSMEVPKRRIEKLPQPATGLFFFPGDFSDPYVTPNPRYEEMIQPEATFGAIALLKSFMETTKDPKRREEAGEFLALLYDGLLKVYRAYGGEGTPYATVDIQDYFNTMESMAATATAGATMAILKGAEGSDFIYWAPPAEFLVDGKSPTLPVKQPLKVKVGERAAPPQKNTTPQQERPRPPKAETAQRGEIGIQVQQFSSSSITLKVTAPQKVLQNSLALALIKTDVWYIQPYAESTFPIGSDGTVVINNLRGNFEKGNTMILVVDKDKWKEARNHLRGDKSYMADWEMQEGPIREAIIAKSVQDGGRKSIRNRFTRGALVGLMLVLLGITSDQFVPNQELYYQGIMDHRSLEFYPPEFDVLSGNELEKSNREEFELILETAPREMKDLISRVEEDGLSGIYAELELMAQRRGFTFPSVDNAAKRISEIMSGLEGFHPEQKEKLGVALRRLQDELPDVFRFVVANVDTLKLGPPSPSASYRQGTITFPDGFERWRMEEIISTLAHETVHAFLDKLGLPSGGVYGEYVAEILQEEILDHIPGGRGLITWREPFLRSHWGEWQDAWERGKADSLAKAWPESLRARLKQIRSVRDSLQVERVIYLMLKIIELSKAEDYSPNSHDEALQTKGELFGTHLSSLIREGYKSDENAAMVMGLLSRNLDTILAGRLVRKYPGFLGEIERFAESQRDNLPKARIILKKISAVTGSPVTEEVPPIRVTSSISELVLLASQGSFKDLYELRDLARDNPDAKKEVGILITELARQNSQGDVWASAALQVLAQDYDAAREALKTVDFTQLPVVQGDTSVTVNLWSIMMGGYPPRRHIQGLIELLKDIHRPPAQRRAAKQALVSVTDVIALRLRSAHLEERISDAELERQLERETNNDPFMLYASFGNREMFGDLANMIFQKLKAYAETQGKSLNSLLLELDPHKELYESFILASANFNKLDQMFTTEEETSAIVSHLFTGMSKEVLEEKASRLTLFVGKVLNDRKFHLQDYFQRELLRLYGQSSGLNRYFIASLLGIYEDNLVYLDKDKISDIVQENRVPISMLELNRIHEDLLFKASKTSTAKVVFADEDAVSGHFQVAVDMFTGHDKRFPEMGGYHVFTQDETQVTLENQDKSARIILIKSGDGSYDINPDLEDPSVKIIMSRSHAGSEGKVFKPQEVPQDGVKIFFVSACRSVTGASRIYSFYPNARFIGTDDVAYGDRSNIVLFYMIEGLGEGLKSGTITTWSGLKAFIRPHLENGIASFVFPGEPAEVIPRILSRYNERARDGGQQIIPQLERFAEKSAPDGGRKSTIGLMVAATLLTLFSPVSLFNGALHYQDLLFKEKMPYWVSVYQENSGYLFPSLSIALGVSYEPLTGTVEEQVDQVLEKIQVLNGWLPVDEGQMQKAVAVVKRMLYFSGKEGKYFLPVHPTTLAGENLPDSVLVEVEPEAREALMGKDPNRAYGHAMRLLVRGQQQAQATAKDGGIRDFQLRGGATLRTRLSPEEVGRLETGNLVSAGETGRLISIGAKVPPEWSINTRLEVVSKNSGIDLVQEIISKATRNPDRIFTVVDWGSGEGVALTGLSQGLEKRHITNVRLIAFSNRYFETWQNAPPTVTFILDTMDHLPNYFSEGEIDLLYSNRGLIHLVKKTYVEHLARLYSLIRPGGNIVDINGRNVHPMPWDTFGISYRDELPMYIYSIESAPDPAVRLTRPEISTSSFLGGRDVRDGGAKKLPAIQYRALLDQAI